MKVSDAKLLQALLFLVPVFFLLNLILAAQRAEEAHIPFDFTNAMQSLDVDLITDSTGDINPRCQLNRTIPIVLAAETVTIISDGSTGAFANCSDQKPAAHVARDELIVSCRTLKFRTETERFEKQKDSKLFVGVLSSSNNVHRRDTIRTTWAKGNQGVFFIVGGNWDNISTEFHEYGDMIWVDVEEDFHKIPFKTATFFAIVNQMAKEFSIDFSHAMKTDDDSYVALDRLEMHLKHLNQIGSNPHYMGKCGLEVAPPMRNIDNKYYTSLEEYPERKFPPFCQGCGFLLSRSVIECISSHSNVGTMRYLKHEDIFIGLLVQRCNVDRIHSLSRFYFRQFRTGWSIDDGNETVLRAEKKRIQSQGDPLSDEELPRPEMASKFLQHRMNSRNDTMRHYISHHDPRLVKSVNDLTVGDSIEHYVSDLCGWVGAKVVAVHDEGRDTAWITQLSLKFYRYREIVTVPYIPYLGNFRRTERRVFGVPW